MSGANPPLRQVQRWMRWVITEPAGVHAAIERSAPGGADRHGRAELRRRGDGREPSPRCLGAVVDAPPLTPLDRLSIYAEAYFARLCDCLAADFKSLRRVLGHDLFRGIVAEYLAEHPSSSFTAAELGKRLPEFLKNHRLAEALPYLPDLAALEWACVRAFYAKEAPVRPTPPGVARGRARPADSGAWARKRLRLDSSVTLLMSDWAIDDMWRDETQPAEERARWLLVHCLHGRPRGTVQVDRLEPLQFEVLRLVSEGTRLAELCERIEPWIPVTASPPPLDRWFAAWTAGGVVLT